MRSVLPHLSDKKHVIWDWNGTLLRDIDHAVQVTNRLLREESLPATDVNTYLNIFCFPVVDYYRRLGFDVSPEKFKDLCERFNSHFIDGVMECGLWPGAVETLADIKREGKTQSVLSASEQGILEHQMKIFDLNQYFDHVKGIADKAAGSKIARGHELMLKAGMAPGETIMIGDTDHDLEVGNALGIDVILVEHGHQHPERLHKVHHKVLKLI